MASSDLHGESTAAYHIREGQRALAQGSLQEAQTHFLAAQAINGLHSQPADPGQFSDEDLWESPLGHRVRNYADKLLAGESERIGITDRRQLAGHHRIGVEYSRNVLSTTGETLEARNDGEDGDPWAYWRSPEIAGLREVLKKTDGTPGAAREVTKAYIAGLDA